MIKYDESAMISERTIIPDRLIWDGNRPKLERRKTLFTSDHRYPPPDSLLGLIGQISEMKLRGIDVTSLAGGLPPKKHLESLWRGHFLTADERISAMISEGLLQVEAAAQYGSVLGNEKLRTWVAEDVTKLTGRKTGAKEILTTTGGGLQYGLSLTLLSLCLSENKVALTSQKTYSAFMEAAQYPADIPVFSVTQDSEGMIPDELDDTLMKLERKGVRPGLVYAMAISNPDGLVMSDERGRRLNEVCKKHKVPFFVDYAYYKLTLSNVASDEIPKISYLDENVILGFTASKLGAPAERVGYLAIPGEDLYTKLEKVKRAQMILSPVRPELAFWLLANSPDFDDTVRNLVKTYEAGITAGLEAVQNNKDIFQADPPKGGMFIWVKVPDGISTYEVCGEILNKNNIGYAPGIWFQPKHIQFSDGEIIGAVPMDNFMRLCVVTETPETVSVTIDKLAQAFRDIAEKKNIALFNPVSN